MQYSKFADPQVKVLQDTPDFQESGIPVRWRYENVLSGRWRDLPVTEADCSITTDTLVPHHMSTPYGGGIRARSR